MNSDSWIEQPAERDLAIVGANVKDDSWLTEIDQMPPQSYCVRVERTPGGMQTLSPKVSWIDVDGYASRVDD
jgi:hypothetical protein